jgi:hypothetical protein
MMKRLTTHEVHALHLMLIAKYRGGQAADTLADDAMAYLLARGWPRAEARFHGQDAALRAVAAVDGVAGAVSV